MEREPALNLSERALQRKILTARRAPGVIVTLPRNFQANVMLSLRDCLDHSNLSELEVGVLADYTGLSPMLAATLAGAMLQSDGGADLMLRLLQDAEKQASQRLNMDDRARTKAAVERFRAVHKPELH